MDVVVAEDLEAMEKMERQLLVVVAVFLGSGLAAHLVARVVLYRWGWRAGWDVVGGVAGRFGRGLPRWCDRLLIPLALLAAVSLGLAGAPGHNVALSTSGRGLLWFILGLPCGGLVGHRPLPWSWICWGAGIVVVLLGG